jgi:uncharacterized protein
MRTFNLRPAKSVGTLLLILVSVALGDVRAQESDKRALAERLVKAQQGQAFDGLLVRLANTASGPLVQQIGPRIEQTVPQANREAARKELNDALNVHLDEILKLLRDLAPAVSLKSMGPQYEQRFTTEELRQLVQIYESPVLKKHQQIESEIVQKMVQDIVVDTEKPVAERSQAFLKRADDILAKNGATATKETTAPAPAKAAASAAGSAPKK